MRDAETLWRQADPVQKLVTPLTAQKIITSAEILALAGTPIQLLPAIADNDTKRVFQKALLQKPAGTAYTAGTATYMEIRENASAGSGVLSRVTIAGFMDQATAAAAWEHQDHAAAAVLERLLTPGTNNPLYLGLGTGTDMTLGTSDLWVTVFYTIVPITQKLVV